VRNVGQAHVSFGGQRVLQTFTVEVRTEEVLKDLAEFQTNVQTTWFDNHVAKVVVHRKAKVAPLCNALWQGLLFDELHPPTEPEVPVAQRALESLRRRAQGSEKLEARLVGVRCGRVVGVEAAHVLLQSARPNLQQTLHDLLSSAQTLLELRPSCLSR